MSEFIQPNSTTSAYGNTHSDNIRNDLSALKSDVKYAANDNANYAADRTQANVNYAADRTQQNVDYAADKTAQNVNHAVGKTADNVNYAADRTAENVNYASDKVSQKAQDAKDATAANVDYAAGQAKDLKNNASAKAQDVKASANANLNAAAQNARNIADNANVKLQQVGQQVAEHPLVQETKVKAVNQLNALDHELSKYPVLNELEARTRIPKTYIALGGSAFLALTIFFNPFGSAQVVTNFIGWAVAAVLSCKALETRGKNDDKQWLTYWIVFGYLNFIESSVLSLILYYVPRYFVFKLAFTVWLMLPTTRGAEKVYYTALHPLFQQAKVRAQSSGLYVSSPTSNGSFSASSSRLGGNSTFPQSSTGTSTGINVNPSTGFSSAGTTGSRLPASDVNPTFL